MHPAIGLKHAQASAPRRLVSNIYRATRVAFPNFWLWLFVGRGSHIFTYTPANERLLLSEEAKLALYLERFVEVGSHLGGSSVVLAEVLKRYGTRTDRRLACIDTWMNDAMSQGQRDTRALFDSNVAPWSEYIIAIRSHSQDAVLPFVPECDLVFLDGDHSYEATRGDAALYAPMVRVGGRLIFHDHEREGVARVIGEILSSGHWSVARMAGHILSLKREV